MELDALYKRIADWKPGWKSRREENEARAGSRSEGIIRGGQASARSAR